MPSLTRQSAAAAVLLLMLTACTADPTAPGTDQPDEGRPALSVTVIHLTDLGNLGDNPSESGNAINGFGQVAGTSDVAAFQDHAFLWEGGSFVALGALGLGEQAQALAVNDIGQVAGLSTAPTAPSGHAVLWTSGSIQDLGTLGGGPAAPRP